MLSLASSTAREVAPGVLVSLMRASYLTRPAPPPSAASVAAGVATVASAGERLLRELARTCRTAATLGMYHCKAGHVVRLLGPVRLADLTHAVVLERFVAAREAEGAGSHTVHRELTALRLLLKSAAREGEFSRQVGEVLPRYAARYVPRTRWLTESEVLAVCEHLDPSRAAVIAFCVATGANFGECFRVERGDVTFRGIRIRGTKRATRLRVVPWMAHVWPLLAYALERATGLGELLFARWSNMRRDIRRACECAGIPPFTSNDLRRTCATWLVKRGVPLNLAARVLGHASTAMLHKVYGILDADDVGALINARVSAKAGA